jgi:hypothetical protein
MGLKDPSYLAIIVFHFSLDDEFRTNDVFLMLFRTEIEK